MSLPSPFSLVLVVWSMAVFWTSVEAMRRTIWYRWTVRRSKLPTKIESHKPSVLVVRPCAGLEASLERTLSSLGAARFSFDVRCRFAVESEADAAMDSVRRAIATLSGVGIVADVVQTGGGGPNRKVAQLAAVVDDADVLVVADSDVDLAGVDLDVLVAPLWGDGAAWVSWAPPVECAKPRTWGDRASQAVLGASLHSFPILARIDSRGLVGKLFAIRREALFAIGGFGSLVKYLGEDMEIARRIRASGGRVVSVPLLARSLASGRSWSDVVLRFSRWLTVIRSQRSILLWSYPVLFFATWPIVIASMALCLMDPFSGGLALLLVLTTRLCVALLARHISGGHLGVLGIVRDAILADVVLAYAFVHALRARTVKWRGHVLVVDRSGQLRESS